jgi:hypothetical protein
MNKLLTMLTTGSMSINNIVPYLVGMYGITMATYLLRNIPAKIKGVIMAQFTTSVDVEEEDNASTNIGRLEMFGKDSSGLHTLDQEMGTRTYTVTPYLAEIEAA